MSFYLALSIVIDSPVEDLLGQMVITAHDGEGPSEFASTKLKLKYFKLDLFNK